MIKINDSDEYFDLTHVISEADSEKRTFLHLSSISILCLGEFRQISKQDELNQISQLFPKERKYNSQWEFIIPTIDLNEVIIDEAKTAYIFNDEKSNNLAKEFSNSKKMSCSIDFKDSISNIESWRENFPSHWRYKLVSSLVTIYDELNSVLIKSRVNTFSELKITEIKINYSLSEFEFLLISELLKMPNVKSNLTSIYLEFSTLDKALEILDYCAYLIEIDEIVLRFSSTDLSEDESKNVIKDAKNKFTIKSGIISVLCISMIT